MPPLPQPPQVQAECINRHIICCDILKTARSFFGSRAVFKKFQFNIMVNIGVGVFNASIKSDSV